MIKMTRAAILAVVLLGSLSGLSATAQATDQNAAAVPSPFGIGGDRQTNNSAEAYAKWIPQMAEIGIKTTRNCNTKWMTVEPQEGKWAWDGLDAQMSCLDKQGIEYGGMLLGWGAKDGVKTLPVSDLPAWSNYVSEIVKHCKGKIKRWEVWNEPPNFTGKNQTEEDYAKIVVAAYDAAKAADPNCLIGLAAKSAHINYLEQTIQAGAKDHFDFITVHPYELLGGVIRNQGTEALFMNIVPSIRKMLARVDPARAGVPVIFTELGVDSSPPGKGYGIRVAIAERLCWSRGM